jgi:hypothetical protein
VRTRILAGVLLGVVLGCTDEGSDAVLGDACEGTAPVCARATTSADLRHVAVCLEGIITDIFTCPAMESCVASGIPGTAACSEGNSIVPYAPLNEPCPEPGVSACSFDRRWMLRCDGGDPTWTIESDCSDVVLECGAVTPLQDASCTDEHCVRCL